MKAVLVAVASTLWASLASADWLVLASGDRSEVRSVEVNDRAVRVVTLNGKTWMLPLDAVDVVATLAANARAASRSPTVPAVIEERPAAPPPPPAPAPSPAPPPPAASPRLPPKPSPPPRSTFESAIVSAPPPSASSESFAGDDPRHRVALFFNGAVGSTGLDFGEARSYELFRETASLETRYEETPTPGLEVGALVRVKGPVGFMASAELFDQEPRARYSALVPHPFFYDRLREASGLRTDLSRRERAFHLDPVASFAFGSRVLVDVFSGVSLFSIETDVVEEISYEEVFPFEELVATGSTLRRMTENPWGYNVGASATFRVAGMIGFDFGVRYSRARVRLVPAEGREITFDAGGLRIGAGLRLLFR